MNSQGNSPCCYIGKRFARLIVAGLAMVEACGAISDAEVVNVSPTGFTVLWSGEPGAEPWVRVFEDQNGLASIDNAVGIEAFPLHTGSPSALTDYDRRASLKNLRARNQSSGVMQIRVSKCRPGRTYYFQILQKVQETTETWPSSGPFPGVRTATETDFVISSRQLLLGISGTDLLGRVIKISSAAAPYGLTAVIGDGAGTNQVYFNLSELLELTGARNYLPVGRQEFTVETLGGGVIGGQTQKFVVDFGDLFRVAGAEAAAFDTGVFELSVGTALVQVGQSGSVDVRLNTSHSVTRLRARLTIRQGPLDHWQGVRIATSVDQVMFTEESPGNWLLEVSAQAGQTFEGDQPLIRLSFDAPPGQPSAFVPLILQEIEAFKSDQTRLFGLTGSGGRVIVLGQEPLLEAFSAGAQERFLKLYGRSGRAYRVEQSIKLNGSWTPWKTVFVDDYWVRIDGVPTQGAQQFYRAAAWPEGTALLTWLPGGLQQRALVVQGQPGRTYELQTAPRISAAIEWMPALTLTLPLTNTSRVVEGFLLTNNAAFYRAVSR